MAMEMKELERIIDERSQKQIASAKEEIKNELGAVPQAQIDEAVKKAVSEINAKAENDKAENVKYLEAFKEAVGGDRPREAVVCGGRFGVGGDAGRRVVLQHLACVVVARPVLQYRVVLGARGGMACFPDGEGDCQSLHQRCTPPHGRA